MPKKEMNTLVVGTNEYEIVDSTARSTLSSKQDTLVSGTNIKTINSESLLGSGNIDIEGDIFKVNYSVTPYAEVKDALESKKAILIYMTNNSNIFQCTYGQFVGASGTDILLHSIYKNSNGDLNLSIFTVKPDNSWSVAHTKLQGELVSGTNIKTINNTSILGSGNIDIQGGGSEYTAGDGINITSSSAGDVIENTAGMYLGDDTSPATALIDADLLGGQASSYYQPKLTAGTNITIDSNNVISSSGGGASYSAGTGLTLTGTTFAIDETYINTLIKNYVDSLNGDEESY